MKETVKDVVKVNKKTEEMDVEDVHRKINEENYKLKQQIQIPSESVQLTRKVLAEDQLQAVKTGYSRGFKWSKETILKTLGLCFTCGTTGYNYIREVAPFPSVRTLQRNIENISFGPGLLRDIFLLIKEMGEHLDEIHKFCCLVFSEMSIQERIDFDRNSNAYIGYTTLPGLPQKVASKLLAFFSLSGICKRWRQIVAYHFTPLQTHSKSIKEIILSISEESEKNGKMKVTTATNVISPDTAGALFCLSETTNDPVMETTIWLINVKTLIQDNDFT